MLGSYEHLVRIIYRPDGSESVVVRISNPNIHLKRPLAPRPAACAEDKHDEIANIAPQKRRARASGPYEAPKATARLPRGLQRAGRAGGAMGRNTSLLSSYLLANIKTKSYVRSIESTRAVYRCSSLKMYKIRRCMSIYSWSLFTHSHM